MTRESLLAHEFVEHIPTELRDGMVYVCIPFATVVHRCCCGCGLEVVTPLSPTDWRLTFDGQTISLAPSIGNWGFPCRSHYWIRENKVKWAAQWSQREIDAGRAHDRLTKETHFRETTISASPSAAQSSDAAPHSGLWQRLKRWILVSSTRG